MNAKKTGPVQKQSTPAGVDLESLRALKLSDAQLAEAKRNARVRTEPFRQGRSVFGAKVR